jgi:AraC-like DNA-binding protein
MDDVAAESRIGSAPADAVIAPPIIHRAMAAADRHRALRALAEAALPADLLLSAPQALASEAPRGIFRSHPLPRMHLVVRGGYHVRTTAWSGSVERVLTAGAAAYWPPHAASEEIFDAPCEVIGVTIHAAFLRLIRMRVDRSRTVHAASWHAPTSASATLGALTTALDRVAASGADLAAAPHLLRAIFGAVAVEAAATGEAEVAAKASPTWDATLAYLEDNLGEPINCKTVARAMDLHPNYLSRLAPQQTGMAFKEVIKRMRLARAVELLTRTRWPIAQVSAASGYGSPAYFVKVFAHAHGATPSEYRRDHAE